MASWGEPVIRWLLSTVASAMIFDDHDVHDDWNTSIEWVRRDAPEGLVAPADRGRVRELPRSTSTSATSPTTERAEFELYQDLRTAPSRRERLREFARRADAEVEGTRWSFCRDIGPARLVMVDSRAGRVLDPGDRSMVDPDEWQWITEHAHGRPSSTC